MGEDEDAGRARCLDEACCGDRLSGRRRVAEAIAAHRARVGADERRLVKVLFVIGDVELAVAVLAVLAIAVLAALLELVDVLLLLGLALVRGDERGEHPRERIHLVAAQLRTRGEVGRLLAEDSLEAEHEREPDAPLVRRLVTACLELDQRVVERAPSRRAVRKSDGGILVRMEDRLSHPLGDARGVGEQAVDLRGFSPLV